MIDVASPVEGSAACWTILLEDVTEAREGPVRGDHLKGTMPMGEAITLDGPDGRHDWWGVETYRLSEDERHGLHL